jgi:hypothetical protein
MTGKKIVRMMALALPVMALMAVGPILVTQSHSSDSVYAGISERPGKQLTLTFTNDTGVEVDGLQIEFKRVPAGIQSVKVEPFKSTMAILKSNVLVLTNGRVGPGEKVRLTVLADPMELAVTDFQWIRQGVLIAGKSRQIEIEERVINRETVLIDRHRERARTTVGLSALRADQWIESALCDPRDDGRRRGAAGDQRSGAL